MKNLNTDFLVVGGGIVGLAIARAIRTKFQTSRVVILEKENFAGKHQSILNSNVLHAGIYYDPGTFKAKFCVQGSKLLKQYHRDNNLPLLECGKLIVAKDEAELTRLHEFYHKGLKNGVHLELVNEAQARQIEPHLAKTLHYPMIWSPNTAVGAAEALIKQLESDVRSSNVEIFYNEAFKSLVSKSDESITIETSQGRTINTPKVINCAGLYADKVAKQFGEAQNYGLLPLKGIYTVDHIPYKELGLRSLVYPVAPSTRGFSPLGLHTTILPNGQAKLGPTDIPGFWREHYHGLENIKIGEVAEITKTYLGALFSPQGKLYFAKMLHELKNYNLKKIVEEGQKLVDVYDDVHKNYRERLTRKRPGIHAQLIDTTSYELVDDFTFINRKSHLHVMNIISPGWTSSFAIAEHVKTLL